MGKITVFYHGRPQGQKFWPTENLTKEDSSYLEPFLDSKIGADASSVMVIDYAKGNAYYSFVVRKNVIEKERGTEAYFAITLKIEKAFCKNVSKLHSLLSLVYAEKCENVLFSKENNGMRRYRINNFDEIEGVLSEARNILVANFEKVISPYVFSLPAGMDTSRSNNVIKYSLKEADSAFFLEDCATCKVVVSADYPRRDIGLQQEIKKLEQEKTHEREEAEKKTTQLRDQLTEKKQELDRTVNQVHLLDNQVKELQSKIDSLKNAEDEIKRLKKERDKAEQEGKQLSNKIQELQSKIDSLKNAEDEIKRLKKESDDYKKQYNNKERECDKIEQERKQLSNKIQELQSKINSLKNAEDENKRSKKELDKAEQEIDSPCLKSKKKSGESVELNQNSDRRMAERFQDGSETVYGNYSTGCQNDIKKVWPNRVAIVAWALLFALCATTATFSILTYSHSTTSSPQKVNIEPVKDTIQEEPLQIYEPHSVTTLENGDCGYKIDIEGNPSEWKVGYVANVKLLKDGVSQGHVEWDVTGKADLVNPNSIHFTGIGAITVRAKIIGNKEDTIIQGYFDVKK